MDDFKKWHLAWAKFDALRLHPPTSWDESAVQQYHQIVTALEEAALGEDLSQFRIPDGELKHKVLSARRMGRSGTPGSKTLSTVRYCNEHYMRRQIEGISHYFHNRQPATEPRKIGF